MLQTADTTRLYYDDPQSCSLAVSRLLYPSTQTPWRANSVIIASDGHFPVVAPIVSLIHFPYDAPVLFSRSPQLSQSNLQEIMRLQPEGRHEVPQVILAGPFSNESIHLLHRMGMSTLHFSHPDPIVQSLHIAAWRMKLLPDMMPEMVTKNTFLVSVETPEEFLPALGFSAHMGTPILYTTRNKLPPLTKQFLAGQPHRNVSIIGSERTISLTVEAELKQVVNGTVERFGGITPFDLAVRISRTKSRETEVGWERSTPGKGDAFSFMPSDWRFVMLSAPLSHLGKHTPLLPLPPASLPKEYIDYLEYLRPTGMHPEPPFMHAFVLGDERQVTFETQLQIESHIMFKETHEDLTQNPTPQGDMEHHSNERKRPPNLI